MELQLPTSMELPVVAMRDDVVLPVMPTTLSVGREKSVLALNDASGKPQQYLALFMQRNAKVEDPGALDLHQVGTLVRILKVLHHKDKYHVVVEGVARIVAVNWTQTEPYLKVSATIHNEPRDALIRDAFRVFFQTRWCAAVQNELPATTSFLRRNRCSPQWEQTVEVVAPRRC